MDCGRCLCDVRKRFRRDGGARSDCAPQLFASRQRHIRTDGRGLCESIVRSASLPTSTLPEILVLKAHLGGVDGQRLERRMIRHAQARAIRLEWFVMPGGLSGTSVRQISPMARNFALIRNQKGRSFDSAQQTISCAPLVFAAKSFSLSGKRVLHSADINRYPEWTLDLWRARQDVHPRPLVRQNLARPKRRPEHTLAADSTNPSG